jgi:predicted negative regulator of RcsB-dependent stress response
MAVYDLEEQDQLDDLKAWWKQWGNVVTGVAIAACVGIVGVQGWRMWTHSQAEKASALYTGISAAVRANDIAKAKDGTIQLEDRYAGTGYAPRAALLVAKMMFDAGDRAGAMSQLQWVIDRADEDELKQIARFRLAEAQLDDRKYDDALRTLDAKHGDSFAGIYADLRGDIQAAAGRPAEARTAYQDALTHLDTKSPYRGYVQVKLDSLPGGTPAAGSTAATAAPAPAPAATAAAPTPLTAPAPTPAPAPAK